MKAGTGYKILAAGSALLLISMFLLPVLTKTGGSIVSDTLSDMGEQGNSCSIIPNSLVIAVAFSAVTAGWKCYDGLVFHRAMLLIAAISFSLTAVFNQAPEVQTVHNNRS